MEGKEIFWGTRENGLFAMSSEFSANRENGLFATSSDFLAKQGEWAFRDTWTPRDDQRFLGGEKQGNFSRKAPETERNPDPPTNDTSRIHRYTRDETRNQKNKCSRLFCEFVFFLFAFFGFWERKFPKVLAKEMGKGSFGERGEGESSPPT